MIGYTDDIVERELVPPDCLEAKAGSSTFDTNLFHQAQLRRDLSYLRFNLQDIGYAVVMAVRVDDLRHGCG